MSGVASTLKREDSSRRAARWRWAAATGLATLLAVGGAAHAQPALPGAQSYAQATSTDYAGGTCDSGLLIGTSSISASCAVVSPGSVSGAMATAGYGIVRITSNADAQTIGTDSHSADGWSNASFTDWIAIAGPAGKTGTLTGTIYFSGGLGVQANGSMYSATNAGASYSFSASFFGQNVALSGSMLQATNGVSNSNNPAGGAFTVNASVSFDNTGWAIGLVTMTATTQSQAAARPYYPYSNAPIVSSDAHASAGFGHTLYWGGISNLTVDGVDITGYATTSASGADYRFSTSPVPEPSAVALLLAGLGLVALKARRRSV